ncbi:MAG: 50S ribosomal protein L11 [Candidatus Altiarchaeales archaeon]|nr:MAG: 50S ribosomal protein L11 [Candidatus Altiarchaeales archaeon]HDI72869.1 50S ribosomal protein L11 [Candidatus Altiarchaeales archaeon]
MAKETIETMVEAGNASAGPPLGPALGPIGININEVINTINEKTSDLKGMKIPIKVIIDTETKKFEIKLGSPPTSALIKRELSLEKGTRDGTPVGDLSLDQLMKIVNMKRDSLLANDIKGAVKEVAGTCGSLGVTIEGISAKDFISELNSGKFNNRLE